MISFFSASLGDEISGPRDLCSPLHPGTYRHKHVYNKWVVFGIEYLAVLITSKLKQDCLLPVNTDMYCWKALR